MSGIISRKPFVGVAAGTVFIALGLLVTRADDAPGRMRGLVTWLYGVVGYSLLIVGALSLIAGISGLWWMSRRKGNERGMGRRQGGE